jgi:hypothetical protein
MTQPNVLLAEAQKTTQPEEQPKPQRQWFKPPKLPQIKSELVLISGALLAAIGLTLTQPENVPVNRGPDPNLFCQEIVQPKAKLTREQLAQLLTVPERGARPKVQGIVKEPYCRMSNLTIRAGATTERVAYPLASEPQTWLVILYEGDTYVGYGFKRS